ncbi:MAG: antitermination protein NusG [Chitinophagaceae bacterium]|nr:MAG: antitermination protein NusG [Chitinophagaceae bacterium]
MNTNLPVVQWYAVCTRPKSEKKVASTLSRNRFETFLPVKTVTSSWSFLRKTEHEPLFSSIVFVKATEDQLAEIRNTKGVVNFLYWLNAPAVISEQDITGIRDFLSRYQQVQTVHVPVRLSDNSDRSAVTAAADLKVAHLHNTERVLLASLGYMLLAPAQQVKTVPAREVPMIYPYFRYTDAG